MTDGSGSFRPVDPGPFDEPPQEVGAMLGMIGAPFIDQDPQGTRARWLTQQLDQADVARGAYDDRIVTWLSAWEPSVIQTIGGWVTRASGRAA